MKKCYECPSVELVHVDVAEIIAQSPSIGTEYPDIDEGETPAAEYRSSLWN